MTVVHSGRFPNGLANEVDDVGATSNGVSGRVLVVLDIDDDIIGEHLRKGQPLLGVHQAEVPRLELFDRLELEDLLGRREAVVR